jgi:hypothetical protein
MRYFAHLIALWLVATIDPSAAQEPACKAVSKGGAVLETLRSCDRLYCSPPKSPATRDALKVMNETLSKSSKLGVDTRRVLDSYKIVCSNLYKNFCEQCPVIEEWRMVGFELHDNFDDMRKLVDGMKDFDPAMNVINSAEGDLACFKQIKDLRAEATTRYTYLVDEFRRLKCVPEKR